MTLPIHPDQSFVLASASPRRREILERLGMRPVIDPSLMPEPERHDGESPARYVRRAARLKAGEVAGRHNRDWVIGADTVVVAGDRVLGKPGSEGDARRMLRLLSGRWHEVVTGVCLLDGGSRRWRTAAATSRVHLRRLSAAEIQWYLSTGEHRDKAGAYGIQGFAALFVDRIEGCYFNIVGFPITTFFKLCRRMGVRVI